MCRWNNKNRSWETFFCNQIQLDIWCPSNFQNSFFTPVKKNPSPFVLSHQIPQHMFRMVFSCKRCLTCVFPSWFRQDDFSLEKAILWIKGLFKPRAMFEVKTSWWMFFFFVQTCSSFTSETSIDGLESCTLLVMFLSDVWSLILTAPIYCKAPIYYKKKSI